MKSKNIVFIIFGLLLTGSGIFLSSFRFQTTEPWNQDQLLQPADLANTLSSPAAKKPMVFCIGPGALIKGSIDMGPAHEADNLKKFKKALSKLPRNTEIVIYCGCCPFEHCPNIRPAFKLLTEMKFTNQKLLNLEHNLRTDWIEKGYPVNPN